MKRNVTMSVIPQEEITIEDLVLKTDKDQKVKKVIFQTSIGEISWRANIAKRYKEMGGFKVESKGREKPTFDELPQVLYDLRDQLQKGPVTVVSSYRRWNYGGDRNSYTFNDEQIYAMEISKPKTEKKSRKK